MRISDYRFTASIKDKDYWPPKKPRLDQIREEEFEEELKEALYRDASKTKKENVLPLLAII